MRPTRLALLDDLDRLWSVDCGTRDAEAHQGRLAVAHDELGHIVVKHLADGLGKPLRLRGRNLEVRLVGEVGQNLVTGDQ